MMANERAAEESPYMRALELQRRRIGDYQKVHFRVPKSESFVATTEIDGGLASRKQPVLQPHVASYSPATSKSYLKQTEGLWCCMGMSRQEATSSLLDRPTGSFFVRSSSNAPYALTVRIPDSDPPVTHFLVHRSPQQCYYIQGSNFHFRTLYELLTFYSFNQSGGMPCLLRPPKLTVESSDSEDSDDEEIHSTSFSDLADKQHFYDRISPLYKPQGNQPPAHNFQFSSLALTEDNNVPPPLPPRQSKFFHSQQTQSSSQGLEMRRTAQRVASYVDTDAGTLLRKLTVSKSADPYTKCPTHRTSIPTTRESFEPLPPNRNFTDMDKQGGISQNMGSEPAPPYRNFTIMDEQKRTSQNMGSEPAPPYRNFAIMDDRRGISQNMGSESAPPYRSPNQISERVPHKELVQPVLGGVGPPIPPRSLPPPIPPRGYRSGIDLASPGTAPPIPSHTAPPIPSHTAPPIPSHTAPPIPSHTAPPPLPPKPFVIANDNSSLQETRNTSPVETVQHQELGDRARAYSDIFSNHSLRRSSSDTSIVSHRPEISDRHKVSPTPVLGESHVTSNELNMSVPVSETASHTQGISAGWELVANIPAESSPQPLHKPRRRRKPAWTKKIKWPRKPRKRLKSYIIGLAEDTEQEFGRRIHYFHNVIVMHNRDPHQKLIDDVRRFINKMRESLLTDHRPELLREGMDSCRNFEHLLESSLQQCIVMPLHNFILTRLEKELTRTGSLQQLKAAIADARGKTAEDLGIRCHLLPPSDKALQDINGVFERLRKSYCAMKKLEYLLEAVRLTYEAVRDSNNPKKPMNDLGADDFLPLFVWVLAHCGFETAEVEAEYMWGLAHPSLFNGEGGYYLTTLTSAVNVLKELCSNSDMGRPTPIPSMNDLQTVLQIHFEDQESGKFLEKCLLPVIPTMTSSEICDMIAEHQNIPSPSEHVLVVVVGGQAEVLADDDCPQEIKKKWELEDSVPSRNFIAYMKRAHLKDGQQLPPPIHEY